LKPDEREQSEEEQSYQQPQTNVNTRLYVGNLSYNATENDLQDLFAQFGPVTDVNLMLDRATGRPRGFAFVTMATKEGAEAAIAALNGKDFGGRNLTVNEARPREDRPSGGPRFGGGGGGGGGRGRRY
jgi:RNA recognition motif-containing protein